MTPTRNTPTTSNGKMRVGTACGACLEHAQSCFGEHAGEGDCGACAGAARCGAVALAV
jgi:hypothetical protein